MWDELSFASASAGRRRGRFVGFLRLLGLVLLLRGRAGRELRLNVWRPIGRGIRQLRYDMGRHDLRLAAAQTALVHRAAAPPAARGHRRILGRRQQCGQDAGAHQHQRLATLPVAAERRQRLSGPALALLLRLDAHLLGWKDPLDQGWLIAQGKGRKAGRRAEWPWGLRASAQFSGVPSSNPSAICAPLGRIGRGARGAGAGCRSGPADSNNARPRRGFAAASAAMPAAGDTAEQPPPLLRPQRGPGGGHRIQIFLFRRLDRPGENNDFFAQQPLIRFSPVSQRAAGRFCSFTARSAPASRAWRSAFHRGARQSAAHHPVWPPAWATPQSSSNSTSPARPRDRH